LPAWMMPIGNDARVLVLAHSVELRRDDDRFTFIADSGTSTRLTPLADSTHDLATPSHCVASMVQVIFSISPVMGYSLRCSAQRVFIFPPPPPRAGGKPDALHLLWLKLASDQGMVASRLTLRSEA
jgi:hypothetical protein